MTLVSSISENAILIKETNHFSEHFITLNHTPWNHFISRPMKEKKKIIDLVDHLMNIIFKFRVLCGFQVTNDFNYLNRNI